MDFNLKNIPVYKRVLSYFHPVWLSNEKGSVNPHLEFLLYKDRIQLATTDALYSDGDQYTPGLVAVNYLKEFLPAVKSVLVLGVGLGSMVQIIRKKGYAPAFTLVEIDKVILRLALEYLQTDTEVVIDAVCDDAQHFVANNKTKFDLVFIDIFNSRVVPEFVTSHAFLNNCHACLNAGGRLAFNYIINDEHEWMKLQNTFAAIFPKYHIITSDINRVFIAEG